MTGYKILSLEAKDLYGAMTQVDEAKRGYSIRSADGKLSVRRFTNALDWSLDSMKLEEVYEKRARRKDFAFRVGRHMYTKNVVCVTFNYSRWI